MSSPPESLDLEHTYDRWYRSSGAAHWEDAPGKCVLLQGLRRLGRSDRPIRLLDVGCGTGSFLARIRDEVSGAWELHGMDLSSAAVEIGSERHPELRLVQGDATEPDYPEGSFDIVTCYGSWEHFPEPGAALMAAGRLLRPGGLVLAMIPALGIHRTDRDDEGWYEDTEVDGSEIRQLQWNYRRETWASLFHEAGIHLLDDALAADCGAKKPGVLFFGVKTSSGEPSAAEPSDELESVTQAMIELSRLAERSSSTLAPAIVEAGRLAADCLRVGGKILACGNGGSAADAQHFVAELVGRLNEDRRPWPAVSLTVDPSVMTALGNDYGYDQVFARQVAALGGENDVLIAISTSGRSPNVLAALDRARQGRLASIALLGSRPLPSGIDCDVALQVPHHDGQRVQEIHTAVLHALCTVIEGRLADLNDS